MKITVNGRFLSRRITGVDRYARELIAALDRISLPGEITLAIPPDVKVTPEYTNISVIRTGRLTGILWEQLSFPFFARRQNAVSLNLCNTAPLVQPGVVCIHDLKFRAHPEFFSFLFRLWYRILVANQTRRARHLLTVSAFSAGELVKYYPAAAGKISIIPNAWQHYTAVECDETATEKFGLQKGRYYFAIGSLEPNKNIARIARLAAKMPDRYFAVAGQINSRVFADGLGFDCPPNLKLLGYIRDSEAKALMRDCRAFLFPSIYEGFGIPPLEALSAGCRQVIVSDTPVMHEVFGDSATYFTDDDLPQAFPDHALQQAVLDKFSWEKSALSLYRLLKEIG